MRTVTAALSTVVFVALTVPMANPDQAAIFNSLDLLWLASGAASVHLIYTTIQGRKVTMPTATLTPADMTTSELEEAIMHASPDDAAYESIVAELDARALAAAV